MKRQINSLFRLRPIRFLAGSAVSFVVGIASLAGAYMLLRWPAPAAETSSYLLAAAVAYSLHRRWAFSRRGGSSFTHEILPYTVMFCLSLAFANGAAQAAAGLSKSWTHDRSLQGLVVIAAVIAANAIAIPLRYAVSRWIFTSFALRPTPPSGSPLVVGLCPSDDAS